MHEKRNAGGSARQQSRVPVHADTERDEQRRRHERLRVLEERVLGRRLCGLEHGATTNVGAIRPVQAVERRRSSRITAASSKGPTTAAMPTIRMMPRLSLMIGTLPKR